MQALSAVLLVINCTCKGQHPLPAVNKVHYVCLSAVAWEQMEAHTANAALFCHVGINVSSNSTGGSD